MEFILKNHIISEKDMASFLNKMGKSSSTQKKSEIG